MMHTAVIHTEMPEYVRNVLQEYSTVQLEVRQRARFPLPAEDNPIVISVVRNERDRLFDFLRHYREAGTERFAFVDNGSTDGTVEFLQRQPDADVYERSGPFDWVRKQGWINRVIELYGRHRWFVYADADEHLVFDGIGTHTLAQLARRMESGGVHRVRGFLLDMYAGEPLLQSRYIPDRPLLEFYPFFDRDGYVETRGRELVSRTGGPRQRVFGRADPRFRPELTKYPLFKLDEGEYMVNPHHLWPYEANFDSTCYLAMLHFKFLPSLETKIEAAIIEKNYWQESFEYRCYLEAIKKDASLALTGSNSIRFTSVAALVENRLLEPILWQESSPVTVRMGEAFRRRRAKRLAHLD